MTTFGQLLTGRENAAVANKAWQAALFLAPATLAVTPIMDRDWRELLMIVMWAVWMAIALVWKNVAEDVEERLYKTSRALDVITLTMKMEDENRDR